MTNLVMDHLGDFRMRPVKHSNPAITRRRKPRGPTRFPDIFGAARIAGVSHSHMFRVLMGERPATARLVDALANANHPLAEISRFRRQHP